MFSQLNLLGNALQASDRHHQVVSQNIANVNTPGYKTQELVFDELIDRLRMSGDDENIVDSVDVVEVEGLAERLDGNNVDLEKEVSDLKKNALLFQTYSHLMASKLDTMRRAISS